MTAARAPDSDNHLQFAVAELGRTLLQGSPDFLAAACRVVRKELRAGIASIVELDREHGERIIRAIDGPLDIPAGTRIADDDLGQTGYTCARTEAVISPDLRVENRFRVWQPILDAGARSTISIAIPGGAGPWGMLAASDLSERHYSSAEAAFLESIAHLLAGAIYRRHADAEMLTQRQELEALIHHAPDLISRYAPDTTILFVNNVAREGGWEPGQLVGRRINELGLPPAVEEAWITALESVFRTGVPYEFETESKNGQFIIDVRVVPEKDADGRVACAMAISRDITARRRGDEERIRLAEQLEQTRRAASVSRLGTTVAHEFNNVLMSISPFAEIIARAANTDQRLLKAAGYIRSAITRGRRVTQDIMRFTRPAEPSLRILDLTKWLPPVVQTALQPGSIPVTVEIAAPLYAEADPGQLEQAVTNLLLNARDAVQETDGGGIRVHAGQAEGSIVLTIEDDGRGIAPENLDKIFEPFFTTRRSGAGLGLAVVQQIVERHHGSIRAESLAGQGAAFVITLPAPAAPGDADSQDDQRSLDGCRLLLVEDEAPIAEGLTALLVAGGADVRVARTGGAALADIGNDDLPDAVLLDVGLPDMDGVEVFATVRKRWPQLPIVFTTGHADQARLQGMLEQPHVGHLVKPFELDDLVAAIASTIAR
jgi:PAS domain S-box-containing protein